MKKILIWVCSFILMVFITACDNNEGPFDVKKENGKLILYSNGKLAKGWVEENVTNYNGVTTKVSEIEYDKGLPTGKFKYYDDDGIMFWNADLKRDGNLFKGTITFSEENHIYRNYGEMKGTFAINPNWIVGERASFSFLDFFEKTAVDATYDGTFAKGKYENKKAEGEWIYYRNNGKLTDRVTYKDGKKEGVEEYYYENGQISERIEYKNGEKTGNGEYYYDDGQLKMKYSGTEFEKYYRNGQLKSKRGGGYEEEYDVNGKLIIRNAYKVYF